MTVRKKAETPFQTVVIFVFVFLAALIFLQASRASSQTFPSPIYLSWRSPMILPLVAALAAVMFLIAFVHTDIALIILLFSMLLSPELELAHVTERAVSVRLDDILLIVVFFSWLAKNALHKELGLLKRTPLNSLIIAYIGVCLFSTAFGIVIGKVKPLQSFFFLLKYAEYFILYFLVTNNIKDERQIRQFVAAFLVTGALICAYATTQIGALSRVTAPFEGPQPEPNTLGGYFILLFALCMSLFLYSKTTAWKISTGALAFFIIPPFIFTLSRTSYVAFIPMYLSIVFFSGKNKFIAIALLIIGVLIGAVAVPAIRRTVTSRIEKTFTPFVTYRPLGPGATLKVNLEQSAAQRVESWKRIFRRWVKSPFFGHGVTGVGLVDAQYPRILGETGLVGLSLFICLLLRIYQRAVAIFRSVDDDWLKGLSLGFLAGFIGLLVHGLGANTFIIVRIMEPFWFLAAVVLSLADLTIPLQAAHLTGKDG